MVFHHFLRFCENRLFGGFSPKSMVDIHHKRPNHVILAYYWPYVRWPTNLHTPSNVFHLDLSVFLIFIRSPWYVTLLFLNTRSLRDALQPVVVFRARLLPKIIGLSMFSFIFCLTRKSCITPKNIKFLHACDKTKMGNKILLDAEIHRVSEFEIKNLKISRAFELFEN